MNVLQNLIELYDHLSIDSTYRSVVRKILLHLPEAAEATVYDLAELTESSRTTIWRMMQMLGYERFTDFHYALKQAVKHYSYYNRVIPSSRMHVEEDILQEIHTALKKALCSLESDLNADKLCRLARRVYEADGIYFFFPYRTPAITSFQQNLAMAGKETNVVCLLPDMLACAEAMGENCLVLCMTIEHAETMDMTGVFERLKEHRAYTVLFTGGESKYDEYVKEIVCGDPQNSSVLESITRFEAFMFALSEIFRKIYI